MPVVRLQACGRYLRCARACRHTARAHMFFIKAHCSSLQSQSLCQRVTQCTPESWSSVCVSAAAFHSSSQMMATSYTIPMGAHQVGHTIGNLISVYVSTATHLQNFQRKGSSFTDGCPPIANETDSDDSSHAINEPLEKPKRTTAISRFGKIRQRMVPVRSTWNFTKPFRASLWATQ